MSVEITLEGQNGVGAVLDLLSSKVLLKVAKGAETAANGILVRALRTGGSFQDRTGLLRKAQGNKPWRKNNYQVAIAGTKIEIKGTYRGKPVIPWRYDHLIEAGHDVYPWRKYGGKKWGNKPLGRTIAYKFHKNAFDANSGAMITKLVDEFSMRFDNAVKEAVSEAGVQK